MEDPELELANQNEERWKSALVSSAGQLCQRCQELQINKSFFEYFSALGQEDVPQFETVEKILLNEDCPFCRLCARCLASNAQADDREHLSSPSALCLLQQVLIGTGRPEDREFLIIPSLVRNEKEAHEVRDRLRISHLLDPRLAEFTGIQRCHIDPTAQAGKAVTSSAPSHPRENAGRGQLIGAETTKWQRARGWLDHCVKNHVNEGCVTTIINEKLRPLRLVNVRRKCVVKTPRNASWLTLSYVCGDPKLMNSIQNGRQTLHLEGSLTRLQVPKTISDGMAATEALGEDYLWVDVLCIAQDDDVERQSEIMKMRSIYSGSLLNMVALDGIDSNSGIPGVRNGTRSIRQDFSRLGGDVLMTSLPTFSAVRRKSRYDTRAWTYQEAILSTRSLYFSDIQMYYQCQCALLSESITGREEPSLVRAKYLPGEDEYDGYYSDAVRAYTKRDLSYDGDILAAFAGILDLYNEKWSGNSLCGLPTYCFHEALLWRPEEGKNPSRDIELNHFSNSPILSEVSKIRVPSWSWASWKASVSYPNPRWFGSHSVPLVEVYAAFSEATSKWVQVEQFMWDIPTAEKLRNNAAALFSGALTNSSWKPSTKKRLNTVLLGFWADTARFDTVLEASKKSRYVGSWDYNLGSKEPKPDDRFLAIRSFKSGPIMSCLIVRWEDGVAYRVGRADLDSRPWKDIKRERMLIILA